MSVGIITPPPPRQYQGGTAPTPTPTPPPVPTPTGLIYDSHIDSKLHDGKVRTITQEGTITGCGKGAECRASGSPKIVVNADGTFSLVTGSGTIDNLSIHMRSRHNEGGDCINRFGGFGFALARNDWDSKREPCHNIHDSAKSGTHDAVSNGQYFKLTFSVKDEGGAVKGLATLNGKEIMSRTFPTQECDKSLFTNRSYFWLRGNNSDNGRIYIYACHYNAQLELEAKFDSGNSLTFKSVKLFAI